MTQLLLNIEDESKINNLLEYLQSLQYVHVQQLSEEETIVTEFEKNLMRERLKNARPENFKKWDDIKSQYQRK